MTQNRLLEYVSQDEIVDLTRDLMRINSVNPPGDEELVAKLLASRLEAEGISCALQPVADKRQNLLARLGESTSAPALLLCAHTDTVPFGDATQWDHDPLGSEPVNGRLYGRGATDDKGNLAAMVISLIGIQRSGVKLAKPVVLAAVCDEEVSHKGINAFLTHDWARAKMALVGEWSSARKIILGYRGSIALEIVVHGRGAHGSRPEYGINAIDKMVQNVLPAIRAIPMEFESSELFEQGHPTFNVGIIEGGTKINMVPDHCRALVDIRIMPGQSGQKVFDQISDELRALQERDEDLKVEVLLHGATDPFLTLKDTPLVEHLAASIHEVTGADASYFGKSSTCDANIISHELGIPVVVYGPGNPSTHGPNEYVDVADLIEAASVLFDFTKRACT